MTKSIVIYSKNIPLSKKRIIKTNKFNVKNLFAIVSYWMYDFISQWNWSVKEYSNTYYAQRSNCGGTLTMHRQILNLNNPNVLGDHIDHNGLNNTNGNLRIVNRKQNQYNKSIDKNSTSKYLGVCVYKRDNVLTAQITIDGAKKHLGRFPNTPCGSILAALAYDEAAETYRGSYANLNFKYL